MFSTLTRSHTNETKHSQKETIYRVFLYSIARHGVSIILTVFSFLMKLFHHHTKLEVNVMIEEVSIGVTYPDAPERK